MGVRPGYLADYRGASKKRLWREGWKMRLICRTGAAYRAMILGQLGLIFLLALFVRLIGDLVILMLRLQASSFPLGFPASLFS